MGGRDASRPYDKVMEIRALSVYHVSFSDSIRRDSPSHEVQC